MQADIPPAAVEAAAQSLYTEKGVGIREAAIDAVQAALPHIEADLEARWRERLLEVALDEPAITKAEGAYEAMGIAAKDPYDDTGWAEPMTEAVCAAIEFALDAISQEGEDG